MSTSPEPVDLPRPTNPSPPYRAFWRSLFNFLDSRRTENDRTIRDIVIEREIATLQVDNLAKAEWVFPLLAVISSMINDTDPLTQTDLLDGMQMTVNESEMAVICNHLFAAADFLGVAFQEKDMTHNMVRRAEDHYVPGYLNYIIISIQQMTLDAVTSRQPLRGFTREHLVAKTTKILIDACEQKLIADRGLSRRSVEKLRRDFSIVRCSVRRETDFASKIVRIRNSSRKFRVVLMVMWTQTHSDGIVPQELINQMDRSIERVIINKEKAFFAPRKKRK